MPLTYSLSFFLTSSSMVLRVANQEDIFLCIVSQWKYGKHLVGDYGRKEVNSAPIPLATHRVGTFGAIMIPYLDSSSYSLGNCLKELNVSFHREEREVQRLKQKQTKNPLPKSGGRLSNFGSYNLGSKLMI